MLPAIKHPPLSEPTLQSEVTGITTKQIYPASGGGTVERATITEEYPIEIYKKVVDPHDPNGFYVGDNISILVQINSVTDKTVGKIQLFENADHDAKIVKCLYPIRTSYINDAFDLQDKNSSFLYPDDINDFNGFIKKLREGSDNVTLYLRDHIEESRSSTLTNNNSSIGTLIGELNKIIQGPCIYDSRRFWNVTLSRDTKDLLCDKNKMEGDEILLNRLLLENTYPKYIMKGPKKPHEYYDFNREDNSIAISELNLYPKESLLYRYDVKLENPGILDTCTVVRIADQPKMPDYYRILQIKSLNRTPQFDVQLGMVKLDLDSNTPTNVNYYIKYQGGSYPSCSYDIFLEDSTDYKLDAKKFHSNFTMGKSQVIKANIIYPTDGTFNLPGVTIADVNYTFEKHVTVEDSLVKWLYKYYPPLSLLATIIVQMIALVIYFRYERKNIMDEIKSTNNYVRGLNDYIRNLNEYLFRLDPQNAVVWTNKAATLIELGKNDEALQAAERAIELDPNYATAWINKAAALIALGRTTEADEAFAKAKGLGYTG
jgi:tetratricopeptide (TPR) repeat protein